VIALRAPTDTGRPSYTARPGEAIRVFRNEDGAFAIGRGRITIAAADMRFVTDVVRDLGRIVHGPEGEEVIRQGDALGHRLVIVKSDPPTEPPNGWVIPDDIGAATAAGIAFGREDAEGGCKWGTGAECGSTIAYDLADWTHRSDPRSPSSDALLMIMLRQANRNATGASDPTAPDWGVQSVSARR
jgi:hypothetical protein